MELNQTSRLSILLSDIQSAGVTHMNEITNRVIDNYTVADFLLLNGLRQPPVHMGATVVDTNGCEYIVMEFQVIHTKSGIQETIKIMKATDADNICRTTRNISVDEFYKTFGKSIETQI